MREAILNSLDDPKGLEAIYQSDKSNFTIAFNELYEELRGNPVADVWFERINYTSATQTGTSRADLLFVIIASLIATLIAKIPEFFSLDEEYFYPRNIGFVVFPLLMIWFFRKERPGKGMLAFIGISVIVSAVLINLLPAESKSQTLTLSCIHLPFFLWTLVGLSFMGSSWRSSESRIEFLRYVGDLIVMTAIILLAGVIMSLITLRLFHLIDVNIENVYQRYVIVWGLASAPIFATYIIQQNREIVSKVSPVIARIFSPLVLIIVLAYLISLTVTGKDPYTDRDFLIVFNLLLICVMALILFSVAGVSNAGKSRIEVLILFLLSLTTVAVNLVALSAILFRITEWGVTPNKTAVLIGNLLILVNLLLVTVKLGGALRDPSRIENVKTVITSYLPLYGIWAMIVAFIFPVVFRFS